MPPGPVIAASPWDVVVVRRPSVVITPAGAAFGRLETIALGDTLELQEQSKSPTGKNLRRGRSVGPGRAERRATPEMKKPTHDAPLNRYIVVLRCSNSLIRIPEGRGIRVAPMQSPHGDYELTFRQRTDNVPHIAAPIPRELWMEISGPAPSMEIAINIAEATANTYARQLAFAANAWQGSVSVHLAYGTTSGTEQHQFFQNWVIDEKGIPRVARDVDTDLMLSLLVAITQLPKKVASRISRAIVQYTDALQHWQSGSEVYALSHLYMGVEAITPLAIQQEVARRDLKDSKAIEIELNGPPANSIWLRLATWHYLFAGGHLPNRLAPWARQQIIFRGDLATYRAAQRASNQLEHGLAHHDEIHPLAAQSVGKTAQYLREAILELLPLSEADRQKLKSTLYATPMDTRGFDRQLLGSIVSKTGSLAAADQLHPYVHWEVDLRDYKRTDSCTHEMRLNQKLKPVLATDAKLALERIRFAGLTPTSHTNVEFDVTRGDAPRELMTTKAGAQLAVDHPKGAEWTNLVGRYTLNVNALPPLARFWLTKLDPSLAATAQTLSVAETVDRIFEHIASDPSPLPLKGECETLWKQALDAIRFRELLSSAYSDDEKLIVPVVPANGKASYIDDPAKLGELNDQAVQLMKQLATLLDSLLAAKPE